ncbi:hypothetical protein CB1_000235006 [Camelus ferus]|nr:hypothetical protein CB1_000235006 [Camelus ferus]
MFSLYLKKEARSDHVRDACPPVGNDGRVQVQTDGPKGPHAQEQGLHTGRAQRQTQNTGCLPPKSGPRGRGEGRLRMCAQGFSVTQRHWGGGTNMKRFAAGEDSKGHVSSVLPPPGNKLEEGEAGGQGEAIVGSPRGRLRGQEEGSTSWPLCPSSTEAGMGAEPLTPGMLCAQTTQKRWAVFPTWLIREKPHI